MANNYLIDYSDPLSGTFTIRDGAYNGPGGTASNTTLRLYGRGAPEWGEAVDENFVKLLENFMSATPPLNPTPGQFWVKTYLFYHDTVDDEFFSFDVANREWIEIDVTMSGSQPEVPSIGQYWYDTDIGVLYQYYQIYRQQAASWQVRSMLTGSGFPTVNAQHEVLMWDVSVADWVQAPVTTVSTSTAAPIGDRPGTLRINTTTSKLSFWDGDEWIDCGKDGNPEFDGPIDALNYKIINLGDATNPTDALNLQVADGRYVNISGDTMTGALTLPGPPSAALHAATKAYVDTTAAAIAGTVTTFPSGGIIMWSGSIGSIPAGWVLCNGSSGTPDLRDRFIVGAGLTYGVGSAGGSANAIVVSHSHALGGATVAAAAGGHAHSGSTNSVGDHSHGVSGGESSSYQAHGAYGASNLPNFNYYGSTAPAGSHGHTFTTNVDGVHTHTVTGSTNSAGADGTGANLPPYYALAYIMKV